MSHESTDQYNENEEINTIPLTFEDQFKEVDFQYGVRESHVKELGHHKAFLYAMISKMSSSTGRCFMSNETFAERNNCSVKTIERALKELQDKKFIYRNTFTRYAGSKILGKQRQLITFDNAFRYFNAYLNKPTVPDKVKKDFLNHFGLNIGTFTPFEPGPKETIKETPKEPLSKQIPEPSNHVIPEPSNDGNLKKCLRNLKDEGCSTTLKDEGCLLLRNKLINNERTNNTQNLPHKQLSDSAAAFISNDSLRTKISNELASTFQFDHERKLGMDYFDLNRAYVEKMSNPVAAVISAVKKGYAKDKVEAVQEVKRTAAKEQDELSSNISEAKRFQKETASESPFVKVIVNEYSVAIALNAYADLGKSDQPFPTQTTEISFKDMTFKEKILQWRKKAHGTIETRRARNPQANGRTGTE